MTFKDDRKTAPLNIKLYNDEKKVYIPYLIWNMFEKTCWDCVPARLSDNYYWNAHRSWLIA